MSIDLSIRAYENPEVNKKLIKNVVVVGYNDHTLDQWSPKWGTHTPGGTQSDTWGYDKEVGSRSLAY